MDDVFEALSHLIDQIKKGANNFAAYAKKIIDDFFKWLEDLFRSGKADEVLENGLRLPIKIVVGRYSKRTFDINNCGGKILDLIWEDARITKEGIEIVKKHLSRFESVTANKKMISRLEEILEGLIEVTDYDKRFYTHELREYERYKVFGVKDGVQTDYDTYNNLHTATLEDFKLSEIDNFGNENIYHPIVKPEDFHF